MNPSELTQLDAEIGEINHFVKMYSTFQNEDNLFFLLEFCQGGDLLSRYENLINGMDEEAARFYAANIIVILEILHQKGVVHRDIKSENFLVADDGFLKLTDFGLSKDGMNIKRRAFTLTGTSEFMAPEVLEQTKEGYDFAYDWWSFGCLLYDMLCGSTPFHSMSFDLLK